MDELGDIRKWQLSGYQIEEVKREEAKHDVHIDLSNAVRSIWLLYRRGRWDMIESLGLSREASEKNFELYDLLRFRGNGGLVKSEHDTILFMHMVPGVVAAASELLKAYEIHHIKKGK